MSATSARSTAKLIRTMGLLASASVMSMIMAGEAQANCVVTSPAGASLNNLPTDAEVDCTGVTTGQTIIANGISADIDVAAGASFNNGTIAINGPDTRVYFGVFGGAATTVQDLALSTVVGATATNVRFFNANVTDLNAQINGQQSTLRFLDGTTVTTTPGDILLTGATNNAGPGGNGLVSLEAGSSVSAIGAGNGSYLLTTGSGNETVFLIDSSLTAASDGLLLATGAGSDLINIWGNSTLAGGSGTLSIDGGTEFDRIRWRGGTAAIAYDVDVSNVEEAAFESFSASTPLVMSGTASYATVYISGGATTRFDEIAALGANNAAVQVTNGSTLELNASTTTTFNHVFTGDGTILQTEGANIYNGTSAAFAGTLVVNFNRAILGNSNAMGTADIVNNSLLFFGDFVLANDISGTGQVGKNGPGVGTLSGNNSFTGDLGILAGDLRLTNVNAGGVNNTIRAVNPGTYGLELAIATDGTISNNIGNGIALTKTGAGVVTLTGTNTYAGGTTIAGGALRVDDFARLGSGAVVANAGTSLILNYNGAGQLLQTTPFMSGDGAFIKEGTGDVVMSQVSTYTGGTTIRAGRIGLNNGNALGAGAIQINAGATLGIGNITLLNTITGAGSIVKTASSTAELGADNSGFTGTFDIQDGTVYVTDGRSLGSGSVIVGSGTQLRVDSSPGSTTVSANLSGDGDFYKFGANRLTLTGTNTLTHNVFVDNGTLQIEGSQNIGTANINLTNAGSVLNLATNGSTTFGNNLSGLGSVIKTGTGTVFVTGSNSYAGGTDIQQGAIRVTNTSFLGTGAITVQAGAALDLAIAGQQTLNQAISGAGLLRKSDQGDLTLLGNGLTGGLDVVGGRVIVNTAGAIGGGAVSLAADTQLVFDNSTTEGISTQISGAGAFTKTGTGLLAVNNANSYTGGTLINGGRLVANDSGALGTGSVVILQGAELGIGGITLANTISGAGMVIKTANNTGILTGSNTYTGGTDLQQGTLLVNSPAALGSGGVGMAAGTFLDIDYSGSSNVALNNVLSGAGTLIKDGSGTVVVNAANTFTGGTAINAGRLGLNFGDGLGTGGVTINSGAELALGDVTVANVLTGTGRVIKTSAGTSSLTGTNTYTGGTELLAGTLQVSSPTALGSGGVSMAAGSSLAINYSGSSAISLGNALSGAGSLVKSGTGTLSIASANGYTGGTTISGGVLALGIGSGLGTGTVQVAQGAQLSISGITLANTISGAGQVVKTGNTTGSLTGVNNYNGGTSIQGGTLLVNSTAALGNGGVSMATGTTLNITYSGASNVSLNNLVSGAGSLDKDGTGTVIVTGANTYTGGTTINAGRLGLNSGDALGTGGISVASGAELALGDVSLANAVTGAGRVIKTSAGNTVLSGANTFSGGLQLQGGNLTAASIGSLGSGAISLAGGSSLSVGNAANQTLALALTGAGSLVKVGSGDLTVTGNALTGGLAINAGRVLATGGSAGTGSGAVAISSGAELVYTAATNSTFANGLSGAGTFRKLGTGQLLFSNPFSMGNLAVDAGSVRLNTTLTGNATVASTGRLDGTGRVIGNLTNNGTVAPGNSIGTLNVQGNYVHNAGSVLEIEFDANGGIDLLAVTGTATLNGGTLRFISLGGTEGNGGTFLTATGGVTGTFATVETVGAQLPLAVIYQPNSAIMAPSVLTARPSTFNAQTLAGADTTLTFIDSMGLTDLRHGNGNRVWLSGLGAWGSRSATAETLAYDHDVSGLAGGVNLAVGENLTVGAAIGWASGDITLGSNGGGGEQSTVLGALTVRYASSVNHNAPRLGAGVVYGRIDQDTLRNVSFNGFSASVEGATQSDVLAVFAEAEVPLAEQANWTFAANGRAAYVHLSQDGYTESGASPLRLQLDDLGTSTMEAEGLLSANLNLIDGGFAAEDSPESLDLRFDLGGRYLAALGDRAIPVAFAASNAGVVLQGDTRDVVQGVGGVNLAYTTRSNLSVGVGYRAEIGQRDNHTLRATISLGF